jgi:hypothetical protein
MKKGTSFTEVSGTQTPTETQSDAPRSARWTGFCAHLCELRVRTIHHTTRTHSTYVLKCIYARLCREKLGAKNSSVCVSCREFKVKKIKHREFPKQWNFRAMRKYGSIIKTNIST